MLFACYELSNKITARFIGALPSRFLVIMNLESMESHKNLKIILIFHDFSGFSYFTLSF